MIAEKIPELKKLSADEKLILVGELWDELIANPKNIPITPGQIAELDRRMQEYGRDPSGVTTWEEIKKGILGAS